MSSVYIDPGKGRNGWQIPWGPGGRKSSCAKSSNLHLSVACEDRVGERLFLCSMLSSVRIQLSPPSRSSACASRQSWFISEPGKWEPRKSPCGLATLVIQLLSPQGPWQPCQGGRAEKSPSRSARSLSPGRGRSPTWRINLLNSSCAPVVTPDDSGEERVQEGGVCDLPRRLSRGLALKSPKNWTW